MIRLDAFLLSLAVTSALGAVAAQHQARKLHVEFERELVRAHQLEVELGQLQLEQSTWAAHALVEASARERLGLRLPTANQIIVVRDVAQ